LAEDTRRAPVLVIGLGRFGTTVATTLVARGREVLAVDVDDGRTRAVADEVTHAVQVDATDVVALQQLGIEDFALAVVGIGTDIEASVLATSALVDLGVGTIWAKAISPAHGRILERIGAHRIVLPESDAGERVAHLVTENLLDYIRFDDGFVIVKMALPQNLAGQTLAQAGLRRAHGVTVVGIKPPDAAFTYAAADTLLVAGSTIAVAGTDEAVERFARLT
jgi:trk system potassium uptake protein TrkA